MTEKLSTGAKFSAIYKGERYRFEAAEHFNVGEGWMCIELDGKLPPGVVASQDLSEITDVEPSPHLARLRRD